QALRALAARLEADGEAPAEHCGIVILRSGRQSHQARLEVAREPRRLRRLARLAAAQAVAGGDQCHGERGARTETAAAWRVAARRDLHRRQLETVRDDTDEGRVAVERHLGGGIELAELAPLFTQRIATRTRHH